MTARLWLEPIPASHRRMAVEALNAGDGLGFLRFADNTISVALVARNKTVLLRSGSL